MSDQNARNDELSPEIQLKIQRYVFKLVATVAAAFGILNVIAFFGGYSLVVDVAVQKALASTNITESIMKEHEQIGADGERLRQFEFVSAKLKAETDTLSANLDKTKATDVAKWVEAISAHPEADTAINALGKLPQWKTVLIDKEDFQPECIYRAILQKPSGLTELEGVLGNGLGNPNLGGAAVIFNVVAPEVLATTLSNSTDTDRLTIDAIDKTIIHGRRAHPIKQQEETLIQKLDKVCF